MRQIDKETVAFYHASMLMDMIGQELSIDDANTIESIEKLGEAEEWSAIRVLFDLEDCLKVDCMLETVFGIGLTETNNLAVSAGYNKIEKP